MTVANSVERRLELTINFRTTSTDAVIMHGAGNSDFHTIEVIYSLEKTLFGLY